VAKNTLTKVGGESVAGLLSRGQVVTVVLGYPDGGSETFQSATVVDAAGPAARITKDGKETVINTWSHYFIKAEIEKK
jgi:hypothetical protein